MTRKQKCIAFMSLEDKNVTKYKSVNEKCKRKNYEQL